MKPLTDRQLLNQAYRRYKAAVLELRRRSLNADRNENYPLWAFPEWERLLIQAKLWEVVIEQERLAVTQG